MPSPLVHTALVSLVPQHWLDANAASWPLHRKLAGVGLVLIALCAPDFDFAVRFLDAPAVVHGGSLHSIAAAVVFGVGFAMLGSFVLGWKRSLTGLAVIGALCYGSHIALDWATYGRGVALFWPISEARWQSPVLLFFGLHHSQPTAWQLHAWTVLTEAPVVGLILAIAFWQRSRTRGNKQMLEAAKPAPSPAINQGSHSDHSQRSRPANAAHPARAHDCHQGAIADTHVHLHPCHNLSVTLAWAERRFDEHRDTCGLSESSAGVLMLAESAGMNEFEAIKRGQRSLGTRWKVRQLAEPCSLRLTNKAGNPIYLVAGRQVVTEQKLEVLGLGVCHGLEDGRSIDETIRSVRRLGGLAVLPWGLGKWWGGRGRVILNTVRKWNDVICLADNAGRWRGMPPSPLFVEAKRRAAPVLAGSDPLPLPWEQTKMARLCSVIDGEVDPEAPFRSIQQNIQNARAVHNVGEAEPLWNMVRSQWALRQGHHVSVDMQEVHA